MIRPGGPLHRSPIEPARWRPRRPGSNAPILASHYSVISWICSSGAVAAVARSDAFMRKSLAAARNWLIYLTLPADRSQRSITRSVPWVSPVRSRPHSSSRAVQLISDSCSPQIWEMTVSHVGNLPIRLTDSTERSNIVATRPADSCSGVKSARHLREVCAGMVQQVRNWRIVNQPAWNPVPFAPNCCPSDRDRQNHPSKPMLNSGVTKGGAKITENTERCSNRESLLIVIKQFFRDNPGAE